MANSVKLDISGDASKLDKAGQQGSRALERVGKSADGAGEDFTSASKESEDFTTRVGKLGAGVSGMTDAVDSAGAAVQGLADYQSAAADRAQALARAASDVAQAQEDAAQATRDAAQATIDSRQAVIDEEQARLDQASALRDYKDAVEEHGKNSIEARQAQIDLKQAGLDVQQAQEDAAQAVRDGAQAAIDATDAQLNLAQAQREANPTELQQWADKINTLSPLLTGLVGIFGLVTAAQWALNAAMAANPIGLVVIAIAALVAVIVWIATQTTWFQDLWRVTWNAIKSAAEAVGRWFKDTLWGKWIKPAWDAIINAGIRAVLWFQGMIPKLRSAFSLVRNIITAPFRAAFNTVASAWNNTIGRLHWSVPGWVPGIGGNSISVPNLPHFHSGGVVGGPPGSEQLAVLQAGERVTPAVGAHAEANVLMIGSDGTDIGDALVEILAKAVGRRGGNVQLVLGKGGAGRG